MTATDITLLLHMMLPHILHLIFKNKEKKKEKIENKNKIERKIKLKPSLLFTTLTDDIIQYSNSMLAL